MLQQCNTVAIPAENNDLTKSDRSNFLNHTGYNWNGKHVIVNNDIELNGTHSAIDGVKAKSVSSAQTE